jgi:hypothetical protein
LLLYFCTTDFPGILINSRFEIIFFVIFSLKFNFTSYSWCTMCKYEYLLTRWTWLATFEPITERREKIKGQSKLTKK